MPKDKRIVVDPERPLPPRLSKEWEETFAELILEAYFPETFFSLSADGECPDLRNELADLGVEVTNVENSKSRELDSLYTRRYSRGDNKQREQAAKRIKELGGKIKEFFLLLPVRDRSLAGIYQAVKEKTTKLNQNYKIFAKNFLFIFTTEHIEDEELPEMMREISDSASGNKKHFSGVIVRHLGERLYWFDLEGMGIKKADVADNDMFKLSTKARDMIDNKYR